MLAGSDIPGVADNSQDLPNISVFEEVQDDPTKPAGSQQPEPAKQGAPIVFDIDPRYTNLPKEEAIKRTAQSIIDSQKAEYNKLLDKYNKASKYAEFFDVLTADPNLATAFVRKVNPTLFQDMDVDTLVKKELEKDPRFQNFQYRPDEANIPGALSWRYNREYARLEDKYKAQGNSDYDTLVAERKAAREKDLEKLKGDIEKVKTKWSFTDQDVKRIGDWYSSLSFYDKATIYVYAKSKETLKVPKPGEIRTGASAPKSTEAQRLADQLFGSDKSGVNARNIF